VLGDDPVPGSGQGDEPEGELFGDPVPAAAKAEPKPAEPKAPAKPAAAKPAAEAESFDEILDGL
jgi:3-oxoacyl-ACP reductase-like protein